MLYRGSQGLIGCTPLVWTLVHYSEVVLLVKKPYTCICILGHIDILTSRLTCMIILTPSHTCTCTCTSSPPTSVLFNCCLHLLSLQNGLTALEVARASTDKHWDEEDRHRRKKVVHDYDGVVDLLSGYTAEPSPAILPSHRVSGTISLPLVTSES